MRTIFYRIIESVTKFFNRIVDKEADRIVTFYNNVFGLPQDKTGRD